MMIAETKYPHPRWLEDRALVHSTQSYHFATIRFATSCDATVNRLIGLLDPPFGVRQPTARSIRFGSLWAIIHTRDRKRLNAQRKSRALPNWTDETRGKERVILSGEGLCRGTQWSRMLRGGGSGREHPAGAEPLGAAIPKGRGPGEVSDRSRGFLRGGSHR
jgi:hypothetical protein